MNLSLLKMRTRNTVRDILDSHPTLYVTLLKLRYFNHPFLDKIAGAKTDIVIEGFPRSGNSFCNRAFGFANPNAVIATHVHSSAHVIYASKLRVPILVTVRNPEDCIASLFALRCSIGPSATYIDKNELNDEIKRYINFHKRINKVSSEIFITQFENVTSDFGKVIDELNSVYKTEFLRFNHTPDS